MVYNPKEHHRRSIRLPEYDYTQPRSYYITICTYKKQCWLGDVSNGIMILNNLGHIVNDLWLSLPNRFPHIELDAFVVMPNHLHGILRITRPIDDISQQEQFGKPVKGSIPTVVRSFKSAVTRRINLMRSSYIIPIWQRNYYESVIRVETGLSQVRQYIINNPRQWSLDKENPCHHQSCNTIDLNLYF